MAAWIKNAIGLAFVVVILGVAKQVWFDSVDTEISIAEGKVKTTNVSKPPPPVRAEAKAVGKPKPPPLAECRLPEHGIDSWGKTQTWIADSGWRKGGSSPGEFCGAQKLARESQFPDRTVALVNSAEQHKTVRDPFKKDYYRYTCVFEDRWEPIYKLATDLKCPT